MIGSGIVVDRLRGLWSAYWPASGELTPDRVRDLISRLEAEKIALQSFTAAMEVEFLDLGALLRRITFLAREVRKRSDEVIAAATGRSDAAIQFAFQLLKKAEDLVHASREQYLNVFAVFAKMHADLAEISHERSALMRTLWPLQTINTQFRIQACAFDKDTRAQFFALADSIGGIVQDVETAVEKRFEELDRTGQATGELVAGLTALVTKQKSETGRMLTETRDHLSMLNNALLSSEAAAQTISEAGEKIACGVGRAIVALQCQDMARQKFLHISAAINEMVSHLASGSANGFSGADEADCRRFLGEATRVQLSQLRAVFDQLDEAARQAGGGLVEIDSEAKFFAGHALRSGSAALDGQIIGRAIVSIHAVLGAIESAVASIQSVVQLVQKLKSTFSDCTSQILGLALNLRMVALNAQIFALHVDAGAALEVVAKNTRTIADEAMKQLDGISSRVTEAVDSVVNLEQRLGDYRELAGMEQSLLVSEAGESEKKLRALEEELRGVLTAIGPLERELSETIHRATGSIRFPESVAQASARSTALFEQIALQYPCSSNDGEPLAHQSVRALKRNYTMAHEREVHESAFGEPKSPDFGSAGEAVEPMAEPEAQLEGTDSLLPQKSAESAFPPRIESDEEKLADNVELF